MFAAISVLVRGDGCYTKPMRLIVRVALAIWVALSLGLVCQVPSAEAATTFVDNSVQGGDGDSYYAVFFVRPAKVDPKKLRQILSGYMFIGFGVESKIKGLGRFEAFGLYPDPTHPGQRVLFGALPEDIAEDETPAIQEIIPKVPREITGRVESDRLVSLIVKVDKSDWDRVYASAKAEMVAINRSSSLPVKFNVFLFKCIDWVAHQAASLGLRVPYIDDDARRVWLPAAFIQAMIDANVGYADHVAEDDGTIWTGSIFQGRPHGAGTMAWPNATFTGLARRGHRLKGITKYGGGSLFDGTYDTAGDLLAGTYKWQSGAKYEGNYYSGRETDGTYTNAEGWRIVGSFEDGVWRAGAITSPDGNSVFKGSINTRGSLLGTRDEKGVNGRRVLNLHDDGSVDGEVKFKDGDSYKGTFRPDSFLPLNGVYRVASSGATRTGVFGPDYQLQEGKIIDPVLMFPLPVYAGKIEGGDPPAPPSQGFIAATPFSLPQPARLPGYSPTRSTGDATP
jgi:hypothetical protein